MTPGSKRSSEPEGSGEKGEKLAATITVHIGNIDIDIGKTVPKPYGKVVGLPVEGKHGQGPGSRNLMSRPVLRFHRRRLVGIAQPSTKLRSNAIFATHLESMHGREHLGNFVVCIVKHVNCIGIVERHVVIGRILVVETQNTTLPQTRRQHWQSCAKATQTRSCNFR